MLRDTFFFQNVRGIIFYSEFTRKVVNHYSAIRFEIVRIRFLKTIIPWFPDRPFHDYRASTSGDWRILCSSGEPCGEFWSSEVVKGSVRLYCFILIFYMHTKKLFSLDFPSRFLRVHGCLVPPWWNSSHFLLPRSHQRSHHVGKERVRERNLVLWVNYIYFFSLEYVSQFGSLG